MNAMKMDAKRSICSVKMIIIIVALVFTLIFSSWDMIRASKKDIFACGVIDMLGTALMMDKFKVLMVMFTAGIYTAGFCYDFKHHYSHDTCKNGFNKLQHIKIYCKYSCSCFCMYCFILFIFSCGSWLFRGKPNTD